MKKSQQNCQKTDFTPILPYWNSLTGPNPQPRLSICSPGAPDTMTLHPDPFRPFSCMFNFRFSQTILDKIQWDTPHNPPPPPVNVEKWCSQCRNTGWPARLEGEIPVHSSTLSSTFFFFQYIKISKFQYIPVQLQANSSTFQYISKSNMSNRKEQNHCKTISANLVISRWDTPKYTLSCKYKTGQQVNYE